MIDPSIDEQITAFLAFCRTASLATVDEAGQPYSANLQYANDDDWRLIWISSESSKHSLNLRAAPQAAVTIYSHQDSQEDIHGLQIRGRVEMLESDDRDQTLDLYIEKYPFFAEPPFRGALGQQRLYRFTPSWLRWIDNRRGFGWKVEKTLG